MFTVNDRVRCTQPDYDDDNPTRYKSGDEGVVEYVDKHIIYVFFDKFTYEEGEYGDTLFDWETEIIE